MKNVAAAAVVATVLGGVAGWLAAVNTVRLPKVPITIVLVQGPGGCQVVTVPASAPVQKNQDVEWSVVGGCSSITPDDVELRFQAKVGDSECLASNPLTDGNLKGKKLKKKTRAQVDAGRYCYGIYAGETLLEDPDLELMP
jgi:hypothetical protein